MGTIWTENGPGPRMQGKAVFPAWKVGDRVVHRPTGIVGTVKGFVAPYGILCWVRFDGHGMKRVKIRATDLVVHQVKP